MRLGRHGVLIAAVAFGCSTVSPTVLPTPNPSQEPVPAGPPLAGRIEVTPSAVLLTGAGQTAQLSASAFGHDGAPVPITWSSSDPAQVSVDAQGKLTGLVELGSAVIFADAGDRTTPVAVLIAQPPAGAVLVGDANVISQPQPLGDPNALPQNGDRYRVTLTGLEAPAMGAILLATGSAKIGGRVITAVPGANGIEVEYERVPLPQLFARYAIDLDIPLDPRDAFEDDEPQTSTTFTPALAHPGDQPEILLAAEGGVETEAEFKKGLLTCKVSAAAKFKSNDFDIKATTNLSLQFEGRKTIEQASTPEHTKVVLTGPVALDIFGGVRAEAGFEGKAECEFKKHIPIPIGGVLALLLAVTVPLGISVTAEGKIKAVDVELGPKGHLGTTVTVGFQCDTAACWAIKDHTPDQKNGINFETKVNLLRDSRVEVNVAVNLVTGLGLKVGTEEYALIDAKIGPVQSLNLAFDEAQAREAGYASNYDLKVVGSVTPGEDLKSAISYVFGSAVTLDLSANYASKPWASSPTGTLTAEKARVQVDKPVKLWVDLDPKTIDYSIYGPNVAEVRIARWKDDKLHPLQTIPVTASGQTRFEWTWTPNKDFVGMNELVAYVGTNLLPPLLTGLPRVPLEIAPDSTAYVEVIDACIAELPTPAPPAPPGATAVPAPPAPTAPPEDPCAADVTITFESTSFLREGHLTIRGNLERYIEGVTPLGPDQPVDDFVGTGTVTGSAVDAIAMALSFKPLCDQVQIWTTANGVDVYLTATDIVEGWPGINGPALLVAAFDAQTEPPLSVLGLGGVAPRGGGSYTDVYERLGVDECGDKLTQTTTVTVAPGVAAP